MTGSKAVADFHFIRSYPSFGARHRALQANIKWNEGQTAKCLREYSKVKNNDRRAECQRNATRHTENAQRLRRIVSEVS